MQARKPAEHVSCKGTHESDDRLKLGRIHNVVHSIELCKRLIERDDELELCAQCQPLRQREDRGPIRSPTSPPFRVPYKECYNPHGTCCRDQSSGQAQPNVLARAAPAQAKVVVRLTAEPAVRSGQAALGSARPRRRTIVPCTGRHAVRASAIVAKPRLGREVPGPPVP